MPAKSMTKFLGKIEELQQIVADIGCDGEWKELPNQVYHFTTPEGAILNWFHTTKTVQFQGTKTAKTILEDQVTKAISEWKPAPKVSKSVPTIIPMPSKNADNKRVFVVHGHDRNSRDQLELVLRRLGLEPVMHFCEAGMSG
jgi:predicted nucleotide-binding protein